MDTLDTQTGDKVKVGLVWEALLQTETGCRILAGPNIQSRSSTDPWIMISIITTTTTTTESGGGQLQFRLPGLDCHPICKTNSSNISLESITKSVSEESSDFLLMLGFESPASNKITFADEPEADAVRRAQVCPPPRRQELQRLL